MSQFLRSSLAETFRSAFLQRVQCRCARSSESTDFMGTCLLFSPSHKVFSGHVAAFRQVSTEMKINWITPMMVLISLCTSKKKNLWLTSSTENAQRIDGGLFSGFKCLHHETTHRKPSEKTGIKQDKQIIRSGLLKNKCQNNYTVQKNSQLCHTVEIVVSTK